MNAPSDPRPPQMPSSGLRQSRRPRRGTASWPVLCLLALVAAVLATAPAGALAAPTPITQGAVTWGVKESWRNYVGEGTVSDGASINPDGTYNLPIVSGSYDEETETTELKLAGTLHWQAYENYGGPGRFGLYSTFSEMSLVISPTEQVLRGTNIGYSREEPGGELHEHLDATLAHLDITGATTSFTGGISEWKEIPTTAGPGVEFYAEGTVFDPVSITYTGPGGVPDLGEHFDTPGGAALEPAARWVSGAALGTFENSGHRIYVSPSGQVVHVLELTGGKTSAARLAITALDAATMQPVGTPVQVGFPLEKQGQYLKTAYDPATETIFYAVGGEGQSQTELVVHAATWDPVTAAYVPAVVGTVREASAAGLEDLTWNPVTEELAAVTQLSAAEGSSTFVKDRLTTFKEEGGAWVRKVQTPLPMPIGGAYAGATAASNPFICLGEFQDTTCLGVLPDGSYVSASNSATVTVGGTKLPWPAIHITVNEAGGAETSVIQGTDLPEKSRVFPGYAAVSQGLDGSVVLHRTNASATALARVGLVDGEAKLLEAPYDVAEHGNDASTVEFGLSMAADPAHGWEWVIDGLDPESYVLDQMKGSTMLSRFKYAEALVELDQGYLAIAVAPDGSVYIPVKDKASGHFGYELMKYVGQRATFDEQPADATVTLATGEGEKSVSFTSTVTGGDPAPTRRWQVKAPGASTFTDVEGQTGETLTVDAKPADNGAEYRAVYTSTAGKIASAAATLTVKYAPRIVADVANRTVTEGQSATFLVSAEGNPEPTVTWERRIGGYWQPISASDPNFRIGTSSLTVKETNTEQSGSRFRSALVNSVTEEPGQSPVYSRAAALTVDPKVAIPAGGVEVRHASLDWLGNEQMQGIPHGVGANYFSAGVSDGKEGGYRSVVGDAAVWQVSASGEETLATYATRAAHATDGGEQVARLYGGVGRVEPDGSADIRWDADFSVNFYGGLVPFTIEDPELKVEPDGSGTLTATLVGCASSMTNINECRPLAPATEVVVASFTDATVEPGRPLTIEPEYRGVAVDVPAGAGTQQLKSGPDWGSWPQSFVNFQLQTGLSSYWYSSGEEDEKKPPLPFMVNLEGPEPPATDDSGGAPGTGSSGSQSGGAGGTTTQPGGSATKAKPAKVTLTRSARLSPKGTATVATLSCPKGGPVCEALVPARLAARIGGRRYLLSVLAPKKIKAGRAAAVMVKLPKAAARALGHGKLTLRLRIVVRSGKKATSRVAKVTIVGRG